MRFGKAAVMSVDPPRDRRFPRGLFTAGVEPEARDSLANERTMLAWVRTSLGLLVSGIGLQAIGLAIRAELRFSAAMILVVAGVATALRAWVGWFRSEKSLRLKVPLPPTLFGVLLCAMVAAAGVLVLLGLILG